MNKVYLNTVSLAKEPAIYKGASAGGSGSGVTINNQQKSVDITENGVTEVTADAGFTGLSKVIVNTNVQSGGGGGSDMPVIGDGKTYLYITLPHDNITFPIAFYQSKAYGVKINWGDGSPIGTRSGAGSSSTSHTYAKKGDYVISLEPSGCEMSLTRASSSNNIIGNYDSDEGRKLSGLLKKVEVGNVTEISSDAFRNCFSLESVVMSSDTLTKILQYAFYGCYTLKSVVFSDSINYIGDNAFQFCYGISSLVLPEGLTAINSTTFSSCFTLTSVSMPKKLNTLSNNALFRCYILAQCDFSQHEAVPNVSSSSFLSTPNCKIIVPDALYDEWIAATNWSSFASQIIKKSDWDASQS